MVTDVCFQNLQSLLDVTCSAFEPQVYCLALLTRLSEIALLIVLFSDISSLIRMLYVTRLVGFRLGLANKVCCFRMQTTTTVTR